jgi:1-phosphofructokinase
VALDASGPALAAAVREAPDLAKPNRDELEELVGRALDGPAAVLAAARELGALGIGTVVVSMGAEGALFVRDAEAVHARPPAVRVASTVGAGDAMVAGTVLGALRGLGLAGAAALATACSAVAVAGVGSDLDPGAVADAAAAVGLEDVSGADPGADDEGAGGVPATPAGWPDRHGRRGSGA